MVRTSSGLIRQSGSAGEETARGAFADTTSGVRPVGVCAARSGQQARAIAPATTRTHPWSLRQGLRVMPAETIISGLLIMGLGGFVPLAPCLRTFVDEAHVP